MRIKCQKKGEAPPDVKSDNAPTKKDVHIITHFCGKGNRKWRQNHAE